MISCRERVLQVEYIADELKEFGGELTSVVSDQIDRLSIGKYPVIDELLCDLGGGDSAERYSTY